MSENNKTSSRGAVFVCALALFGESALTLKYSSNLVSDLLGYAAALLLTGALFFTLPLLIRLAKKTHFCTKNFFKGTVFILSALICLVLAFSSALAFSHFAEIHMHPPFGSVLVLVGFAAFCIFAAIQKITLFGKLSIILLPLSAVSLFFIMGFSVGFMDIKYLIPYKAPDLSLIRHAFSSSILVCFPTVLPLTVTVGRLSNHKKATAFCIFAVLLTLCFISPLGLFGSELSSTLSYPYPAAVGTAAIGDIFSRLDPLFYTVAFFSCFFKAALCLKAFLLFLEKFFCEILNFTIEKYDKLW